MEIKTKLINRLNRVNEELTLLEKELQSYLEGIPKDAKDINRLQKITAGLNINQVSYKGFEFVILSNILNEDFNIDFNTEVSEASKERYLATKQQLEALRDNKQVEIPEELKKFLEGK